MSSLEKDLAAGGLTKEQLDAIFARRDAEKLQEQVVKAESEGAPVDLGYFTGMTGSPRVDTFAKETFAKMAPLISLGGTATDILGITEGAGQQFYELGRAYQMASAADESRKLDSDFVDAALGYFGDAIAQLPTMAVGALGRGKGMGLLYGFQSGNAGMRELLAEGAPKVVAIEGGLLKGATEMGFTSAIGKLQGAFDVDTILGKALSAKGAVGKGLSDVKEDITEKASKTLIQAAKEEGIDLIKDFGWETLEEILVNVGQAAVDKANGLDPEAMSYENFIEGSVDATAVTAILQGMLGGPKAAARIAMRNQGVPKQQQAEVKEEVDTTEASAESEVADSTAEIDIDSLVASGNEVIVKVKENGYDAITPEQLIQGVMIQAGVEYDQAEAAVQEMAKNGLVVLQEEQGVFSFPEPPVEDGDPAVPTGGGTVADTEVDQETIEEEELPEPTATGFNEPIVGEGSRTAEDLLKEMSEYIEDFDVEDIELFDSINDNYNAGQFSAEDMAGILQIASDYGFDVMEQSRGDTYKGFDSIVQSFRDRHAEGREGDDVGSITDDLYDAIIEAGGTEEQAFDAQMDLQAELDFDKRTTKKESVADEPVEEDAFSGLLDQFKAQAEEFGEIDNRTVIEYPKDLKRAVLDAGGTKEQASEAESKLRDHLASMRFRTPMDGSQDTEAQQQEDYLVNDAKRKIVDFLRDQGPMLSVEVAQNLRLSLLPEDSIREAGKILSNEGVILSAGDVSADGTFDPLMDTLYFLPEGNYSEDDIARILSEKKVQREEEQAEEFRPKPREPQRDSLVGLSGQLLPDGEALFINGELGALDKLINPFKGMPRIELGVADNRATYSGPLVDIEGGATGYYNINGENQSSDELDTDVRDRLISARRFVEDSLGELKMPQLRQIARDIEEVSRNRGDDIIIFKATASRKTDLINGVIGQISRNLQASINNRESARRDYESLSRSEKIELLRDKIGSLYAQAKPKGFSRSEWPLFGDRGELLMRGDADALVDIINMVDVLPHVTKEQLTDVIVKVRSGIRFEEGSIEEEINERESIASAAIRESLLSGRNQMVAGGLKMADLKDFREEQIQILEGLGYESQGAFDDLTGTVNNDNPSNPVRKIDYLENMTYISREIFYLNALADRNSPQPQQRVGSQRLEPSLSDADLEAIAENVLREAASGTQQQAEAEVTQQQTTAETQPQAAPRRVGDREQAQPTRRQQAAAESEAAARELQEANDFLKNAFNRSVGLSASGLQFLTDEEVIKGLSKVIVAQVKHKKAKLKEVVAVIAELLGGENAAMLRAPLVRIWNAYSDPSVGLTEKLTAEEEQEAFAPYEKARDDASESGDGGLEGGQGSTSVESDNGGSRAGQEGGVGDQLGDVPRPDVVQDAVDGETRRERASGLPEGMEGDNGDRTRSGQQREDGISPEDGTVSSEVAGEDGTGADRLPDESQTVEGSGGRDRDAEPSDVVSRVSDVEDTGKKLVRYEPATDLKSMGVFMPANQAAAIRGVLNNLKQKRGDLKKFVADETGIDLEHLRSGKALFAEQLDAVALAIDAHKRGLGFILGDMTGIGKGRVVASLIGYAIKQGKVPVFLTAKPGLYLEMMKDLNGIGLYKQASDFNPLITNVEKLDLHKEIDGMKPREVKNTNDKLKPLLASLKAKGPNLFGAKGTKPYNVVFTTYSQVQPDRGQYGYRADFLMQNAKDMMFILDESHRASGPANPPAFEDSSVSIRGLMDSILPESAGSFFSSATHAKTAASMSLYSSIGIYNAVDNKKALTEILNKGRDPMLQISSEMSAANGTFIRRERDFEGIEVATAPVETDVKQVSDISSAIRTINDVDKAIIAWANDQETDAGDRGVYALLANLGYEDRLEDWSFLEEGATDRSKINQTPFKNSLHRTVDTASVMLKAQAAVDQAIAAHKRGEKPIIAFDATMASALSQFAEAKGKKIGDELNFTYADILESYLQKRLTIKYKTPFNEDASITVDESQLPQEIQEMFREVREIIKSSRADEMSGSPLDFIISSLEDAGIRTGELTGRSEVLERKDGKTIYTRRKQNSNDKSNTIKAYNSGELDALLINASAAEGFSMHSSMDFADQKPRHMIVLQFTNNIAHAVQILGRINRTNQKHPPKYTILFSDMPAERRPMSNFMRKLKSLNANVKADTDSGGVQVDIPETMNQVGQRVMIGLVDDIRRMEGIDLAAMTNVRIPNAMRAYTYDHSDPTWLSQFTGAMFLLDRDLQERVWNDFEDRFLVEIKELDAIGANPLEAKTLPLDAKTLETRVIEADIGDGVFEQGYSIEMVDVAVPNLVMSMETVQENVDSYLGNKDPEQYVREFNDTLDTEVEAHYESEANRINALKTFSDAQKVDAIEKGHSIAASNIEIIKDVASYAPGSTVVVETTHSDDQGNSFVSTAAGIVLGFKRKRKLKNPATLSQYEIVIAVPDGRVTLDIPFSSVGVRYTLKPGPEGRSREALEQQFAEKSRSQRQVRYIATGNVIRAFEALRNHGTVAFYTDNTGAQKAGVFLDRGFDIDDWLSEQPVEMGDGADALALLNERGALATADSAVRVFDMNGAIEIRLTGEIEYLGSDGTIRFFDDKSLEIPERHGVSVTIPMYSSGTAEISLTGDEASKRAVLDVIVKAAKKHSRKGIRTSTELARQSANRIGIGLRSGEVSSLKTQSKDGKIEEIIEAELVEDSHLSPLRVASSEQSITVGNTVLDNSIQNILQGSPDDNHPAVQAQTLVNTLDRIFKVSTWIGVINPKRDKNTGAVTRGQFRKANGAVEITDQASASIYTRLHEIAHALDKRHNITGVYHSGKPMFAGTTANIRAALGALDYDQTKNRVEEGWAELIRRFLTETEVAGQSDLRTNHKEAVEWLENQVLPAFPELKQQFDEAKKYIGQFSEATPIGRVIAQVGKPPKSDASTKEQAKGWLTTKIEYLRTSFVRGTLPVHRLDQKAENTNKKRGYTTEEAVIARKFASESQATESLLHGVFDPETGQQISSTKSPVVEQGLLPYINERLESEQEMEEMEAYGLVRHIVYCKEKGFAPDYEFPIEYEEAKRILEAFRTQQPEKSKRLEECVVKISRTARDLQLMRMRSGALDPKWYNHSMSRYGTDNYFPMNRIVEKKDMGSAMARTMSMGKRGVEFSRTTYGSGLVIESPLVNIFNMARRYYKEANIALTLRDIDESIDNLDDEETNMFATRVDPTTVVTTIDAAGQLKDLVDRGLVSDRIAKVALAVKEYRELMALGTTASFDPQKMKQITDYLGITGQNNNQRDVNIAMSTPGALPDISGVLSQFMRHHIESEKYHVVTYFKDGQPVSLRVRPDIYDVALTLDSGMRNRLISTLDKIMRVFKNSVIGWSLDFGFQDVFVNASTGLVKSTDITGRRRVGTAFSLAKGFGKSLTTFAIPEIYRMVTGKQGSNRIKSTHLLYKRLGASQYSIVGSDRETQSRFVRKEVTRGLRKKKRSLFDRVKSFSVDLSDSKEKVLSSLEYLTALSDAPMRLANMEAYLENQGYSAYYPDGRVIKGGSFYDKNQGRTVTDLPRGILIGAATAAGAANHNFKYRGSKTQVLNAMLPFFSSTITANATDVNMLKELASDLKKRPLQFLVGGDDDKRMRQSRRLLVFLVANGIYGYINHILRRDDEDYANAGEQNNRYYTLGYNGKTAVRIKKNPGLAFASNIGASVAEMHFGEGDISDIQDLLVSEVTTKAIPYNKYPGGLVGGIAQAMTNTDAWGRPIASKSITLSGRSPSYMADESTRALYKFIGEYTGKTGFRIMGPVYLEHIANQALGNIPEDMARLFDVASGKRSLLRRPTEMIPGIGSVFPFKKQINPVYDLREQAETMATEMADLEYNGGKATERYQSMKVEFELIRDYTDLSAKIMSKGFEDPDRQDEYFGFANGIARLALGLKETDGSPNLFAMNTESVPEEVLDAVDEFIKQKTRNIFPVSASNNKLSDEETYFDQKQRHFDYINHRMVWLEEHMYSPVFRDRMIKMLKDEGGASSIRSIMSLKRNPFADAVRNRELTVQRDYEILMQRYVDLKQRSRKILERLARGE